MQAEDGLAMVKKATATFEDSEAVASAGIDLLCSLDVPHAAVQPIFDELTRRFPHSLSLYRPFVEHAASDESTLLALIAQVERSPESRPASLKQDLQAYLFDALLRQSADYATLASKLLIPLSSYRKLLDAPLLKSEDRSRIEAQICAHPEATLEDHLARLRTLLWERRATAEAQAVFERWRLEGRFGEALVRGWLGLLGRTEAGTEA
jgi:hypothetical protein